jgi:hypothetical protein
MKMHDLDTNGWNAYSFEVDGIKFISKISPDSSFLPKIKMLPSGVFESMNRSAVLDLIGKGLSREEIAQELYRINKDGSHAVIELEM